MLTKVTPAELRALVRLTRQPDWQEVDSLLSRELLKAKDLLVESPDERVLRALQGRAKMLQDLKALVEAAPEQLEKLEARRP